MKTFSSRKHVKLASLMALSMSLSDGSSSTLGGGGGGSGVDGGSGVGNFRPKISQHFKRLFDTVHATVFDSVTNTLYVGGEFTEVSTPVSQPLVIDLETGEMQNSPVTDGLVNAIAADGKGGWYVGGSFSRIGGLPRENLARVLADGTVDPTWNPGADGAVNQIAVSDRAVYVAGEFDYIGGLKRQGLAKLNTTNGAADMAFNAYLSKRSTIYALVVDGLHLYVGGTFKKIGKKIRRKIARLSTTDGCADYWNPNVSGLFVKTIAVASSAVYFGGLFHRVGSEKRDCIAKYAKSSNKLLPFRTDNSGIVLDLAIQGKRLYIGGTFEDFNNTDRNYVVAVNTTDDTLDDQWEPNPNDCVETIHAKRDIVFLGGGFRFVGLCFRNFLAAVETKNGFSYRWQFDLNSKVKKIVQSGSNLIVLGYFDGRDPVTRNHLAAFDVTTGKVTSFNPDLNGPVRALAISGRKLYVGGEFTRVGSKKRNLLAAFNLDDGKLNSWNPNVTGTSVNAIAIQSDSVYVGGKFHKIRSNRRYNIAAINSDGKVLPWKPTIDETENGVNTLVIANNTLYVGGDFTQVNSQPRNRLAAFDLSNGNLLPWDPNVTGKAVYALAVAGGKVYVGGDFYQIGDLNVRVNIAAVDATGTGSVDPWYPTGFVSHSVQAIAISGNEIYIGGSFYYIGDQNICYLAKLALSDGRVLPWNPNFEGLSDYVSSIVVFESTVFAGGHFNYVGEKHLNNIVALNAVTGEVQD